ncbi:MAG: type II toxin-antitoxin system VapC family toxin [Thermoproteota archaeon]|nr:type II toxin-antitoxin system VapC family toxin [Candidatus Brockarchaeota archaeon]
MERIVIDASVAVKWFVPEKDSDKALKLRELYLNGALEIVAPTLIYYEVANALRFHPYYRLSEKELLKATSALKNMQIAIEPTVKTWRKAFEISALDKVSVYDAIYLATSISFKTKLLTSDERMVEKLSDRIKKNVSHLADFTFLY